VVVGDLDEGSTGRVEQVPDRPVVLHPRDRHQVPPARRPADEPGQLGGYLTRSAGAQRERHLGPAVGGGHLEVPALVRAAGAPPERHPGPQQVQAFRVVVDGVQRERLRFRLADDADGGQLPPSRECRKRCVGGDLELGLDLHLTRGGRRATAWAVGAGAGADGEADRDGRHQIGGRLAGSGSILLLTGGHTLLVPRPVPPGQSGSPGIADVPIVSTRVARGPGRWAGAGTDIRPVTQAQDRMS
jgi:hypothetical protein